MTVANVSLTDTFDDWRKVTNQLVGIGNLATEGRLNSTGTLTLSNPTLIDGGVTLNVSNGVVVVGGNTFSANATMFTSNTTALAFKGDGRLGTVVYLDIANLSVDLADTSTSNIASANLVNSVLQITLSSFAKSNAALPNSTATFAGTLTVTGDLILL